MKNYLVSSFAILFCIFPFSVSAAEPNVDSISSASKVYYYKSSSLTGQALLDAITQKKGAVAIATTNADNTPNIATVIPDVVDANILMFGITDNQTRHNIRERKIAVMSFYIYNPDAADKSIRNSGARIILRIIEDKAKIKELLLKTKKADDTTFMEIVKVLPVG